MRILVIAAISCCLVGLVFAGYSKRCKTRQRYGHENGICNERLIFVVHHQVCPVYLDAIRHVAKEPQSPSAAAIDFANKFVFKRLYQQHKARRLLKRSAEEQPTDEDEQLDDLIDETPASFILPKIPDAIAKAVIRREMALSFVRSGSGNPLVQLLNLRNWPEQNIVCECCYNVCTVPEITEYCPTDSL